jgi:ribosomal-protein-alanine N-acetyltransferase
VPQQVHLAGFAGMWQLYDEAHITTIAVDPTYRGRGLGELLFLALVAEALERGSTWLSLEVRASNGTAQRLYEKYGLSVHARRQGYYTNDGEDALVMWSPSLRNPEYRARLAELRGQLRRRLGDVVEVPELPPLPPPSVDPGAG